MLISRFQVGCLLLVLLSISVLNHQVLGARYVKEEAEHVLNKSQVWKRRFMNETNGGSYVTVNREVPSSPDPLHNSKDLEKVNLLKLSGLELLETLGLYLYITYGVS
ncbi:hypothetical protein VNO77_18383 [Canavalia gladiata]|uniref:Uncharacterized protein n=1 Tax=Canavalia gladiata TaxID=3824 RepID=A0AAN9LLE1_CANGL